MPIVSSNTPLIAGESKVNPAPNVWLIGLYLVGYTDHIASGLNKSAIERLGRVIMGSGRMVNLRIGYEFDGEWNGYDPETYKRAFRAIVDTLREMGAENEQTVW